MIVESEIGTEIRLRLRPSQLTATLCKNTPFADCSKVTVNYAVFFKLHYLMHLDDFQSEVYGTENYVV